MDLFPTICTAVGAGFVFFVGNKDTPEARRSILACHAAAKQVTGREDAALCHAVGQACSVVHTAGHALGFPIYELTAIVYRHGLERCAGAVEARRQEYITRLFYWSERCDAGEWAKFLRG